MRKLLAIAAVSAAASCSPAPVSAPQTPPNYTVEPSEIGPGFLATAEAESFVDGQRPTLTLSCAPGKAPSVQLNLVRAPDTPPPLAGVFGTVQVGDQAPERVELSWTSMAGRWLIRGAENDARLAAAIAKGGQVTLTPPAEYAPKDPIAWKLDGFAEQRVEIAEVCAAN